MDKLQDRIVEIPEASAESMARGQARLDIVGDAFPYEPCVVCNMPVRVDRKHWRTNTTVNGSCVIKDEQDGDPEELDGSWQEETGTYAVGPECRKLMAGCVHQEESM